MLKHSIQKQKPVLVVEKLTQGETRLTKKNYGFTTRVEIVYLSFLPAFALLCIVGFSQYSIIKVPYLKNKRQNENVFSIRRRQ